jgi:hypothetical protein
MEFRNGEELASPMFGSAGFTSLIFFRILLCKIPSWHWGIFILLIILKQHLRGLIDGFDVPGTAHLDNAVYGPKNEL